MKNLYIENNYIFYTYITSFRQIFEPAQNGYKNGGDRHRSVGRDPTLVVIVIEAEGPYPPRTRRCVFLLAEKVRNANDEGSSWKIKHTCEGRKIPFIEKCLE
jgi:hypothetical protein